MWVCQFCIMYSVMDQFRNDVALWVKKLRGRYDAKFIEPENVNKISWAVKMPNICIICHRTSRKFKDINFTPFPKKFEIREKWLKSLKMLNCVTGRVSTQGLLEYWLGSSSRHFLRFLSNIFKKQSRNLCFTGHPIIILHKP